MKFRVFLLIVILAGFKAYSQGSNTWSSYMANYDGDKPGSVLVDLGIYAASPDKEFPFVIITGPIAHKCGTDGLPDTTEIDKLDQIITTTRYYLEKKIKIKHVGTFMNDCKRLNFYYVTDTADCRKVLSDFYTRSFKEYEFFVKIKQDDQWDVYRKFLYPSEEIFKWMKENHPKILNEKK